VPVRLISGDAGHGNVELAADGAGHIQERDARVAGGTPLDGDREGRAAEGQRGISSAISLARAGPLSRSSSPEITRVRHEM
jgi:hypothetical protein